MLAPIHEQTYDRASGRNKLVKINPTRRWVGRDHIAINFQLGKFRDDAGNEVPLDTVPAYIREDIARNPVRAAAQDGPDIATECQVCHEWLNKSLMEAHLYEHISAATETIPATGSGVPPSLD